MLKRPCKYCKATNVVNAYTVDEPHDVKESIVNGYVKYEVLSTRRARYTYCTECGARDA